MDLFRASWGIVPACDMSDLAELERVVKATHKLSFVQGYKVGMVPALSVGLAHLVATIRKFTDLPIIYDHQKFGTDIPEICGGEIVGLFSESGVQSVIIFPHAGIRTLEAATKALFQAGLIPMVGGEMTHPGYLQSEGGYIADGAPTRIYMDAVGLGVSYFIVPGTRLQSMARFKAQLDQVVVEPKFLFPGVGRGQGGDIVAAFKQVAPAPAYAIVGRGITAEADPSEAAKRLWGTVESSGII